MPGPTTLRTFVLVGALLLLVAGLAKLSAMQSGGPTGAADVRLRIDDPNGRNLYDKGVHVEAASNSVLDALEAAGRRDGFTVETKDYAGLGAMVIQIFSYRNSGPCGWVYEVEGRSGDRSAELYLLDSGDDVHWFWSCHD